METATLVITLILTCLEIKIGYSRGIEATDPCFNATKMDGYRYGMLLICGGYWQCVKGKSVAKCCSAKEIYHPNLHTCIPDTNLTCNNTNCGVINPVQECRHTPKMDSRTEFQEVVGGTTFTFQCPPGTVFLQEICSCTFDKEQMVVVPGCKPIAYSSFDSIIPEEGIQSYGVEMIDDGKDHARAKYVYLNGSAYVNIVTLSNSYFTKTLAISFWIRPDGNFNHTQTILTNHIQIRRNCKDVKCDGSVEIRLRPNNKLFTFVVSENRRLKLTTNITFGEWNQVWFVYESEKKGVFGVKSGNSESYIVHKGFIDQRMSGLILGRPSITRRSDYFTGAIDEFKVYKCIPDEAKEALSFI
ncbi:hypothetical protein CHS0354_025167 [Potamilus streckersoni]|uniref:Chitin-binding type-2 domain-containing protein n=1 Tax=Potamilus streckersoni TaxID=2493646 RepID=A0AAE0RWA2_9BIVA|nr:hypothetical protein CHS0354_025167 [Potamilus streckersoni]